MSAQPASSLVPQTDILATAHALRDMSGDSQLQQDYAPGQDVPSSQFAMIGSKRGMGDDLLASPSILNMPLPSEVTGPEKKRRKTSTEQQMKRHKYDILKAFFRVYFAESKEGMVLKDSIYNLYARKIPTAQRIARNAMYRHMWSFFKNKIMAFQSNYREYIKGIKLLTSDSHFTYEGCEKDIDLLNSVGVNVFFDFQEEELEKNIGGSSSFLNDDDDILGYVTKLESTAKDLAGNLRELKMKLKKQRGGQT